MVVDVRRPVRQRGAEAKDVDALLAFCAPKDVKSDLCRLASRCCLVTTATVALAFSKLATDCDSEDWNMPMNKLQPCYARVLPCLSST